MPWQYLPSLIAPLHEADVPLACGIFSFAARGLPEHIVDLVPAPGPDALQSAIKKLDQKQDGNAPGMASGEDFHFRIFTVCGCDSGKPIADCEELQNAIGAWNHRGVLMIRRDKCADDLLAAAKSSGPLSWTRLLMEQRNPNQRYVHRDVLDQTMMLLADLIVNADQANSHALDPVLGGGDSPPPRCIFGAAAFDPGGDLLKALRLAATDSMLPRVMKYMADEGYGHQQEQVADRAGQLAGDAVARLTTDIVSFKEPASLKARQFSADALRYFSSRSRRKRDFDTVTGDFRGEQARSIEAAYGAAARSSQEHREGLRRVVPWADKQMSMIVEQTKRADQAGGLWVGDLGRIMDALLEPSPGRALGEAAEKWEQQFRAQLAKLLKLKSKPGWTSWPEVNDLGLAPNCRPNWWLFAGAAAGIALLVYLYAKVLSSTWLLKAALLVAAAGLAYLGWTALSFRRFKERIVARFVGAMSEVERFFVLNAHMQYMELVREGARRLEDALAAHNKKVGALLSYLREQSMAYGMRDLAEHEELKKLEREYGKAALQGAIKKINVNLDASDIEEVAAFLAQKLSASELLDLLDDPASFEAWLRHETEGFYSSTKGLDSLTVLSDTDLLKAVGEKLGANMKNGETLPCFRTEGETIRGILFYPQELQTMADDLLEQIDATGMFEQLALHERGRIGVLNFYEVSVDANHP